MARSPLWLDPVVWPATIGLDAKPQDRTPSPVPHSIRILLGFLIVSFSHTNATFAAEVVARLSYGANKMVYDQTRDRVYIASGTNNSLLVLNAKTAELVTTISVGSSPTGLALSPDYRYVYVANSGATINGLAAVNLTTLALDPAKSINTLEPVWAIAHGANNILYALSEESIRMYNTATRLTTGVIGTFSEPFIYSGDIAITPDRKTLYYAQFGLSPSDIYKISLETPNPSIVSSTEAGSNGQALEISHNGEYVVSPNGAPYLIRMFAHSAFPGYYGIFNTGAYPRLAAFCWDDSLAFTYNDSNYLGIFSTKTFSALPNLSLNSEFPYTNPLTSILAEPSDSLLFLGSPNRIVAVVNPAKKIKGTLQSYSVNKSTNQFSGSFLTYTGVTYYLQYSTDLTTWTNLGAGVSGNGQTQSIQRTFPDGLNKIFFRIVVP